MISNVLLLAALAVLAPASAQDVVAGVIAPIMGSSCKFMVFGTSAITTGATGSYDGSFGISPTTIAAVTIPDMQPVLTQDYYTARPQVNGLIHPPGETSDQARSDFLSAYAYANALAPTMVGGDTILGGRTFTPGVYHWSVPSYSAADSTITLAGALGDVFIMQVNTLTTGAGSKVVLTGGVEPSSVFWILESTLTLGASSEFYGIAMAGTAVTVGASVKWVGAVYAKSAVTFGNAVEMVNGDGMCAAVSLTPSGAAVKARRAALETPRWDREVKRNDSEVVAKGRRAHVVTRAAHGSKRASII